MPSSKIDFQRIGFDEANPFLTGALKSAQTAQQMMMGPQQYLAQSLANQKAQAELPYAGELAQGTAAYKNAMAQYLLSPNQALKGLSAVGKTLIEPHIIQAVLSRANQRGFNPNNSFEIEAAGPGNVGNSSQEEINNLYHKEGQKLTSTGPQLNNAQSAQMLWNEVKDIDIAPLQQFSGLGGKTKLFGEKAKGIAHSFGLGEGPSESFRDYQAYLSINKNIIMDSIRKTLATSVVPGYVMETLAPLVSPGSAAWEDPEQVSKGVETLQDWVKNYASQQTQVIEKGVPTTLEEAEERYTPAEKKVKDLANSIHKESPEQARQALMQQNGWTQKDIEDTMEANGLTEKQVWERLVAKERGKRNI